MTTYTVLQGRTLTLQVQWLDYPGGPASPVTGVTIEIKPVAGGASIVGPTATGVTLVTTGLYTYQWVVPAAQAVGDYLVTWRATDASSTAQSATDIVTVTAQSAPITGSYATAADYTDFIAGNGKATPNDINRLLKRASELLDACLSIAIYDVDPITNLPTDALVIDVFRRATCAQVEYWDETGDELGSSSQFQRLQIGPVQLDRPMRGVSSDEPAARLAPQARAILQTAGLRLWVGTVDTW